MIVLLSIGIVVLINAVKQVIKNKLNYVGYRYS